MTITLAQLLALAPLLIVGATVCVVMAGVAIRRHHFASATLTVLGLNAALASLLLVLTVTPIQVTPLFMVDNYAVGFIALILIASLACSTLAHAYLEGFPDRREEFYMLLGCAVAGAITLVCSRDLAALFIGLELLSVPVFGMAAYSFRDRISLEAGIKYLVLSAAASAMLVFGMALLYASSGSLAYAELLHAAAGVPASWLVIGAGLLVAALAFKLSLVPFHLWTPDVYEGAPAPTTAFLATVGKVAVFALLLRFFMLAAVADDIRLHQLVTAIALASMLAGNLLALRQNNLKRMIGYSSIAHMGYVLTVIVASSDLAPEAAGVYLVTYTIATLAALGVVTLVSSPYDGPDAGGLHYYRGLFWRRPYLAAVLTVAMLSLAGVPVTAGFIGKFYALTVGVQAGLWWLVGGVVIGSGISLYYYLRVAITLYLDQPGLARRDAAADWGQRSGGIMVLLLVIADLFIGIYPQPLITLAHLAHIATP